jgi:uncharacterized membrane protein YheB (UPF0754 family)
VLDWILGLLPWIIPPIVGAVIGYVTNDIAIRMLFRPLTEKRIFGLRVPLTPGIIPKQRYELAESIGRMVSRELVNEETLRRQIHNEAFERSLERSIVSSTGRFLESTVGDLLPSGDGGKLFRGIEKFASSAVSRFIGSRAFHTGLERIVSAAVHELYRRPLSEFLPEPERQQELLKRALDGLTSEPVRDSLISGITGFLMNHTGRTRPTRDLLPPEFMRDLDTYLKFLYPKLFDGVLKWMRAKKTRVELEIRGRFLLRDILAKLSAFQRLIVNAGQYGQRLSERMPEIIDDLIASVEHSGEKPENQRRIIISVEHFIRKWLQKSPAEIASELGVNLEEKIGSVFVRLFERLSDPGTAEVLSRQLRAVLEEHKDKTIEELSNAIFGLDEAGLSVFLISRIESWLTNGSAAAELPAKAAGLVASFFESRRSASVREVLGISEEFKAEIDAFILKGIVTVLDKKLPEILASFDIQKLVVDKINGLDVESVEQLLLMVIAKHLKWINLFGALLGGFIGAVQVALSRLM